MQSLLSLMAGFGAWNWLILAVALLALEFVVPGVHFLWFGLAAIVVGGLALATGVDWPWQIVLFGLVSVLAVFWVRTFARSGSDPSDAPDLNVRGAQYVGRHVLVEDAIVGGRGKVRVGDSVWAASGPDAAKGTQVKVTGNNGSVLVVAPDAA